MLYVSIFVELLRSRPALAGWIAALAQAFLWTLVPALFYLGPPGEVPFVLAVGHEFPLGTYLGWNVTAEGFHKGQLCNYAGGWIPFAKTKAERMANDDPRLSLEERYGSHEGYVAKVKEAAQKIVAQGFLLQADANRLIDEAEKSNVLR